MEKTHLVLIDPQNDFCHKDGTLFVGGADEDMKRVAALIRRSGDKINTISVTLDSHHVIDVAHPAFWKDTSGDAPAPFTIITMADLADGTWRPAQVGLQPHVEEYVGKLDAAGNYPLCIWPPHCLMGSWGATVHAELFAALCEWEVGQRNTVNYITKGSNQLTEHYSAIKAEVFRDDDPSTGLNIPFIQSIQDDDNVLIAGEASSHCVLSTVKDIAQEFGSSNLSKIVLITDCMSPVAAVPGVDFPQIAQDFQDQMIKDGMRETTSTTWMAQSASSGVN